MNKSLFEIAQDKSFGILHKVRSYFEEYDFCFKDFRDRPIRMLEIGVSEGGSLAMWKDYFPKAEAIVGIDVNPNCARFAKDNIQVFIGDQTDVEFLSTVHNEAGPFDIIIDDGGHTMKQNIMSFRALFPLLNDNGIYVIEDLHTSYWPAFRDYPQTTISFLKKRIDDINFWATRHSRAGGIPLIRKKFKSVLHHLGIQERGPEIIEPKNLSETSIRSIYFAESIAFIRKGRLHPTNDILRF